jgi:diaminohydroxyphosphoribosylaminopyrimidine deaminase / 5-amino-6-(5-phosphoribosylamino)uracil reductase
MAWLVTSFSSIDHQQMSQALRLAEQGLYTTTPNPRVGCVIVSAQGDVVGQGFHLRAGEPHAEVHALAQAGMAARGSTVYVTLEPCAHTGRTPPCADALINAGVARVVVAVLDSNPSVAGVGVARLKSAGIAVDVGLMHTAATELNSGFLRRIAGGLPWLRVKLASSLDGRTAMASGESKWITGEAARADVQCWRARSCAIITGIGTVRADDPALTVRLGDESISRQPLRVVLDSQLRLSPDAHILQQPGRTWVVTVAEHADADKIWALQQGNAIVKVLSSDEHGRPDLRELLQALAAEGCNEVLVEAGAGVAGAFMQAGLVDEVLLYQAMTLLGSSARPLLDWPMTVMAEQQRLSLVECRQVGDDLRLRLRPQPSA